MGGVGMLRPNFLQTASEGVEKSTLSNNASSATSKQPGNAPSESINVIVVVDGSTSEAKSSETVDGAFESGEDEDEEDADDEEDEEFSSRSSPSTMISSEEDLEEEVNSFTSTKAS